MQALNLLPNSFFQSKTVARTLDLGYRLGPPSVAFQLELEMKLEIQIRVNIKIGLCAHLGGVSSFKDRVKSNNGKKNDQMGESIVPMMYQKLH